MRLFKSDPAVKADAAEGSEEAVHDFTLRTPYWSYRPVPYRSYAPLDGLQAELDRRLDALFSGDIDEGNANVLDGLVFDVVRQARADLDRQLASHRDMIASLGLRPAGDSAQFTQQLGYLKEDLKQNLEEQAVVIKLLRRDEYKEEWQK